MSEKRPPNRLLRVEQLSLLQHPGTASPLTECCGNTSHPTSAWWAHLPTHAYLPHTPIKRHPSTTSRPFLHSRQTHSDSQRLSAKQKSILKTDFQPYRSLAPRLPQPVALFQHGPDDTAGTAFDPNTWGLQAQPVATRAICFCSHHRRRGVQGEGLCQTDCASSCHESSACQIFDLELHAESRIVDSQSTSPPTTTLIL